MANTPSQKLNLPGYSPATGKAVAHTPGASSSNGSHGEHTASPGYESKHPNNASADQATQFTPDPRDKTPDTIAAL